jgi:transposase
MELWRITTWVLALALAPHTLPADTPQAIETFCHNQAAAGEPPCHLQPCPCNPGDVTLKRIEKGPTGTAQCACRSALAERQNTRRKAVAACDNHRRSMRQSCFVSRDDCPRGFEALESFSDRNGNRFSACRDSRHKQAAHDPASRRRPSDQALLPQYNSLIEWLESKRVGLPLALPQQSLETLRNSFPGDAVNRLSLIRTGALEQGCFTDCDRIFCADDGRIERWTDKQQPLISRELLHHIVHAVHCEREGGRNNFVKHWFQHLPDAVHARLQAKLPLDAEQIHFAMYMETHANNRAKALCRHLPDCEGETSRDRQQGSHRH